jgi:hypothetical protein
MRVLYLAQGVSTRSRWVLSVRRFPPISPLCSLQTLPCLRSAFCLYSYAAVALALRGDFTARLTWTGTSGWGRRSSTAAPRSTRWGLYKLNAIETHSLKPPCFNP